MTILFSDQFKQESQDKLGLKRDSAILAVDKPDRDETVHVGNDLTLKFYFKELSGVASNLSLLLYGIAQPNGVLNLARGFKLYPDLCSDFNQKRPTQLLMELAGRFGFQITIGTLTEFFFFHQTIEIPLDDQSIRPDQTPDILAKVVNVHAKKGREFTTEFLLKHNVLQDKLVIDCALLYAIDLDDYRKWLLQH